MPNDGSLPPFIAIPAMPFLFGTPEPALSGLAKQHGGTRESYREESPQQSLRLPAFAIATTTVTNALYWAYVAESGARPPAHWRGSVPVLGNHPVVDITWDEALACCVWLTSLADKQAPSLWSGRQSAMRLPSEAEWEHAARGQDGRSFPWGNAFAPELANTREAALATTSPVDEYAAGASPYGMLAMAGNVWEWTASLDRPYPYDATDGREDLYGSGRRMLRGGCYANPHGFARCACRFRLGPQTRNEFIGFRLAFSLGIEGTDRWQ